MIDADALFATLANTNAGLYDFALIAPEGTFARKLRPCGNCHDGYSIAKAFIMTAVGLLCDDGVLRTDDLLADFVDIPAAADERWRAVRLDHLLRHRAGLAEPCLDIDCDDTRAYPTDDYLSLVLSKPLPYEPGAHYQYSDAVFYLLSRVVSRAAGRHADALLNERLFRPMGFGETAWSRCPMGYPVGGTGLYAAALDVAKLAWLYLNDGVYDDRRLLSAQWTRTVLERGYELHPFGDTGWIGKGGMYGQGMAFHPGKRLAAAWHAYDEGGHESAVFEALGRWEALPPKPTA